jgi:hypothetical protein
MARWNQPAPEQGLLVFSVQLEDFDDQVLKHLNCLFHVRDAVTLNVAALLPKLTPALYFRRKGIQLSKQVFSELGKFKRLVFTRSGQGLMFPHGQRQRLFAENFKRPQIAQ